MRYARMACVSNAVFRRSVKKVSASLVLVTFASILLNSIPASACTCWPNPDTDEMAQEWWDISRAIVLGSVTSIEPVEMNESLPLVGRARIKLAVIEAFGDLSTESDVEVLVTFWGCGPHLKLGQTYLIVAMQFSADEPYENEGCGTWLYDRPGVEERRAIRNREHIDTFVERFRKIADRSSIEFQNELNQQP